MPGKSPSTAFPGASVQEGYVYQLEPDFRRILQTFLKLRRLARVRRPVSHSIFPDYHSAVISHMFPGTSPLRMARTARD